jgi:AcrR family transcriptional regulator
MGPDLTEKQTTVLRLAADWASLNGLNDLTIGRLAKASGMSKAGLHGAFGSKTGLQLATVRFASRVFFAEVIAASRTCAPGLPRVTAFCESWIGYVDRKVFPGGCFFGRVSMQLAGLPPEVSGDISRRFASFQRLLVRDLAAIEGLGPNSCEKYADRFLALLMGYNWSLFGSGIAQAATHVRSLLDEQLEQLQTE